mmetsp:Transcript_27554/g.72441  ORF Transcript_27554/g.72441 Transcript_27554/m.72441 type:complete len:441 (+) Transcript_27554:28-1350(+)
MAVGIAAASFAQVLGAVVVATAMGGLPVEGTTRGAVGSLAISPDYNVSWVVDGPAIDITLSWSDQYDWAAIGLHTLPGQGMANAEIFLCNADIVPACQVRNSNGGYVLPPLDPVQYIQTTNVSHGSGRSAATFRRNLTVSAPSPITVAITDGVLGVIYACGRWSNGLPEKHDDSTTGRWHVNFMASGPAPVPPTPGPPGPPPPPGPPKKAGVWPQLFDARMRLAPSQLPAATLSVQLGSRLRYDFPNRRQRWEYWNVSDPTSTPIFAEVWINTTLYELDLSTNPPRCSASSIDLEILRPDWPVHMPYISTHYLIRQPPQPQPGGVCFTPINQLSDLYQDPAPIGGITNNWFVFNSSIAEPIKLEGPDDFANPTWLTVQDYTSFFPVEEHGPGTFDIPPGCHPPATTTRKAAIGGQPAVPLLRRLQPHGEGGVFRRTFGLP